MARKNAAGGLATLTIAFLAVIGSCARACGCADEKADEPARIVVEEQPEPAVEYVPTPSACELAAACQAECAVAAPGDDAGELAYRQCRDACTDTPAEVCLVTEDGCSCKVEDREPVGKKHRRHRKKHHTKRRKGHSDDPLDGILKSGVRRHKTHARDEPLESKTPRRGGCCKYCTNSQPCGNSCIAYGKTCHKWHGCAC